MRKSKIKVRNKPKTKVGTVLDSHTYTNLKLYAVSQKKTISTVIEEALSVYMSQKKKSVVDQSFGSVKIDSEALDRILVEDFYDQ